MGISCRVESPHEKSYDVKSCCLCRKLSVSHSWGSGCSQWTLGSGAVRDTHQLPCHVKADSCAYSDASWENATTEPCFPVSHGHYGCFSGPRQNGRKAGMSWRTAVGASLRPELVLSYGVWHEWPAFMNKTWAVWAVGTCVSICHLHAWPKPRKRWKGEEKSIQSAYSEEYGSSFCRGSSTPKGGFDQIVWCINWIYGWRLGFILKVHCEDCWIWSTGTKLQVELEFM